MSKDNSELANALAGICGSSTGKIFVHPIDTIKAKIQVKRIDDMKMQTGPRQSLIIQIARDTIAAEGIGGLYRGFSITLLGSMPAAGLYFGSYEFFKKHSLEYPFFQDHSFISYLAGGMFAEAVACAIFVPVDVIKERRQVQYNLKKYHYSNDIDAIVKIKQTEGVRGLYRAYGATVLSFGPFSALYFLFYENIKGLLVQNDP